MDIPRHILQNLSTELVVWHIVLLWLAFGLFLVKTGVKEVELHKLLHFQHSLQLATFCNSVKLSSFRSGVYLNLALRWRFPEWIAEKVKSHWFWIEMVTHNFYCTVLWGRRHDSARWKAQIYSVYWYYIGYIRNNYSLSLLLFTG